MSDVTLRRELAPTLVPDEDLAELKAKRDRQRANAVTINTAPRIESDITAKAAASGAKDAGHTRPDRVGKVMIAGYFPSSMRKQLKHIAIDEGLSLQQVMADAFTMYLKTKRAAD